MKKLLNLLAVLAEVIFLLDKDGDGKIDFLQGDKTKKDD